MWSGSGWRRTSSSSRRRRSEMDRLEEIRKRDAQEIEAADMWIHHYTACSDRRWLLGEVDAQREELGRLIREQAVLKDEDNRLLHEVDRLTQYAEEERSARHTAENFQRKYAKEFGRLREALEFY